MLPTKTTGQRWDCQFLPTGEGLQHFLVWLHQQSPEIMPFKLTLHWKWCWILWISPPQCWTDRSSWVASATARKRLAVEESLTSAWRVDPESGDLSLTKNAAGKSGSTVIISGVQSSDVFRQWTMMETQQMTLHTPSLTQEFAQQSLASQ